MQHRKIKSALARIVLVCLLAALLTPAALADSGRVTASYLNVRSTASASGALVGVLSKDSTVTIVEKLDGWYKVESNGLTGYVSAEYISTDGSSDTSTSSTGSSSSASGSATINSYMVNIRSGASTSSSVIANVGKGTAVTVVATEGDWYKVEYKGQTAYVHKDYVTLDGESSGSSSSTGSNSSSSSGQTGEINASYVRLRSGASLSASILKTLDKGAQMTVTGESGDWYKVSYNGTEGYVYKTYLTVSGSSSSGSSSASAKTGTITGTYVRFRSGASTGSSILTTFPKGASVTVSATEGDWYKVSYNGQTGYVYKSYVSTTGDSAEKTDDTKVESASGTGTIRGSYVRVRAGASTSSSILATVHTGTTMTITGTTGEWYQVSYNGQTGYVYKSYLVDSSEVSSGSESSSGAGEAIVAKAKQYLGVPYVYGGTSPSGFDCSGLVYYVYKQLGYSVYRTATAQYRNGTYVERSNLQPGDIIIFYNSGMSAIGHAGLYIGDNQFIHASSGGGKVQINKLSESYYNTHYYGARRVVS